MSWYRNANSRSKEEVIEVFVHVKPNAKKTRIIGISADGKEIEIAVQAQPIEGKANEVLREFLSELLEVSKSAVVLKRGENSRHKCFSVSGAAKLDSIKI